MVIMDAYYPSDRLQEVWQNIDHLHLSYLEMEESPEKLEHRNRLEDCIREFLCMTSHSQKFTFRETADILHRSASSKKDFSGYKAATGWNAIQLYAGNLLSQPWRKEYKQVKTYCGFYKHQIEANLVGAELMFEAMGYKHTCNGILVLEGPICPDTVTNVSKDCLIAYVECQIIKAIWEELSPTSKISWLDVLEFRKSHLCSPEQSIRALNYQFHQKQYQAQTSDVYNSRYQQPAVLPFPALTTHNHLGMQTLPYSYGSNTCCSNNYATYAHPSYAMAVQCPVKPLPHTNGYFCANGYVGQPHPIYGYTVPTGQLIDLESQHADIVDRPITHSRPIRNSLTNYEAKKNNEIKIQNKDPEKENFYSEDWDYVYRDLESQGYSKDLGERGDILSPPAHIKKSKTTNLDDAMNNLALTASRPLKVIEALEKFERETEKKMEKRKLKPTNGDEVKNNLTATERPLKVTEALEPEEKFVERRKSQDSSYENLSEVKKPIISKLATKAKSQLSPKEKNGNNNNIDNVKWECKSCTFHNEHNKEICDMCSKSRVNVEQQMEIGGPQCSKCTLVNAKDKKECQACGASLKDSPTYI